MNRRLRLALCGVVLAIAVAITGALMATSSGGDTGAEQPSAVDVGFLQDMIVHHQQAVTMSEIVRGGTTGEIASLADVLRGNQLLEIGQMTGFLQIWGRPLVSSREPMTWMTANGNHGNHGNMRNGPMEGMATSDELNRLGELTGTPKEVHFLQLMVRHHQGGVLMAEYVTSRGESRHVQAIARRMAVEQSQETLLMTAFLDQRKS